MIDPAWVWNDPDLILQSINDAIIVTDTELLIRVWNVAAEELFGWRADEVLGQPIALVISDVQYIDGTARDVARQLLVEQGPWTREVYVPHRSGHMLALEVSSRAMYGPEAQFLGIVSVSRDISRRKRLEEERTCLLNREQAARHAAEVSQRRLTLLMAASQAFAEPILDIQELLTTIVQHTVELLGDACAIRLLTADGQALLPGISYHSDPERRAFLQHMLAASPQRIDEGLNGRVLRSGQPLFLPVVPQQIERDDVKPEYQSYVEHYGVHSTIIVPLRSRGRIIGSITIVRDQTPHAYTSDDLRFLQDLADRAAQAIDNAQLHQQAQAELTRRAAVLGALQASEERFRATFNQAAVGIAHVAPDGRWLMVNQRFCAIVGYTEAELLTRNFQDITHPDDLDIDLQYIDQLLRGARNTYSLEKRYLRRNGSTVWVNLTVSLVRDALNDPDYFIAVVEDISERKALETQLLQAQKMESIGQLAGGMAHDFNNILTAISGYAALATESLPANDPVQRDLADVQKAAERAATLVRQLLAFARKQVIEPRVLDLNTLILNMNTLLHRLIGENVQLLTRTTPNLWPVRADPGQIEQVLVNLAVNARDAMPDGGKLIIETGNVTFDTPYVASHIDVAPGSYVMLTVSDTGRGMTPEVRARAFEPFFTTKGPGEGSGLGLATSYGIVKQHSGTILIYSEPGQGTTLKIYLPRTLDPFDVSPTGADALGSVRGSETILLAEDDPTVRTLAAQVLRDQGYTVIVAADGMEALYRAQVYLPATIHLLLTDVVMPKMDGKTLAERIGTFYPGIKILFMSGYPAHAMLHQGRFETEIALLPKPFSPALLARKVRDILDM